MKTNILVHFWSHISRKSCRENQNTHFIKNKLNYIPYSTFTITKAQLNVSAINVGHLQVVHEALNDKLYLHVSGEFTVMFSDLFFPKSCCSWDNVEKHGRATQATDDNTIWCMRFACWTNKITDTHILRICNTYCLSTAAMLTRTRVSQW